MRPQVVYIKTQNCTQHTNFVSKNMQLFVTLDLEHTFKLIIKVSWECDAVLISKELPAIRRSLVIHSPQMLNGPTSALGK